MKSLSLPDEKALQDLAKTIGWNADWIRAIIHNESSWNPQAVNPYTKAVGLIQFMPATLKGLGYTFEQVKNMPIADQLKTVVKKYLTPYSGKVKNVYDAYLTVFYPVAIGKPDSFVFGSERSPSYSRLVATQNPIFETISKDGQVTKEEFKKYVDGLTKRLDIKDLGEVVKKNPVSSGIIVLIFVLLLFILYKKFSN